MLPKQATTTKSGSRATSVFLIVLFVKLVNGWKSSTIVTKNPALDNAGILSETTG